MSLKETLTKIISVCDQAISEDLNSDEKKTIVPLSLDLITDLSPNKVAIYLEQLNKEDILQLCAAMAMGRDYLSPSININIPIIFKEIYIKHMQRDLSSDSKGSLINYLSSKMPKSLKKYFSRAYEILFINTDNYASEIGICLICGGPIWLPEPYNYADSWFDDSCLVEFHCLKCQNKWTKTVNQEWLDLHMIK